ncbi:MAG TPA: ribosome small subunit-dependent GTPase A [Myxococcota bacterium]|nr:ribosome small subunit-dependent GTPase A [Myxococcota bacterium]
MPDDPASPRSALRLWGADESIFSYFDSLSLHHPDRALELGRVTCVHRGAVDVVLASGPGDEHRRFKPPRDAACATGDWVAVDPMRDRIHTILPRQRALVRQSAGDATAAQVLAAHVDVVFVVTSANEDFSQRRLERYRIAIAQSNARAVGVLSKADLVDSNEREHLLALMNRVMPSVAVRAFEAEGLEPLRPHLEPGRTVVVVGSSGVGKSTIVNRLIGEERQAVLPLRSDATGRHTTTRRELIRLASGPLLIDTPGLREVRLWADDMAPDERLAHLRCRFSDCTHRGEPGCAVLEAVIAGELEVETLETLHTLERELAYQARRQDDRLAREARDRWKRISKAQRSHARAKDRM